MDRILAHRIHRLSDQVANLQRVEARRAGWQRLLLGASFVELTLRVASDVLRMLTR